MAEGVYFPRRCPSSVLLLLHSTHGSKAVREQAGRAAGAGESPSPWYKVTPHGSAVGNTFLSAFPASETEAKPLLCLV